jgi:hypothetical protein
MLNAAHLLNWSVITIQQGIAFQIIHNSHFLFLIVVESLTTQMLL